MVLRQGVERAQMGDADWKHLESARSTSRESEVFAWCMFTISAIDHS
jgi:hypothetical protein